MPRTHAAKLDWLEELELPEGIKGLPPGNIQLGQRTLLVGDNGTGKTAVINAMTLLAEGYVNDLGVRDGVKLTDRLFAALVPAGKDQMKIVGVTHGGARGRFSLRLEGEADEGGSAIKKSRRCPVDKAVLVLDEVLAVLRKEPRAVRDYLVGAIYTALKPADLSGRLPEALRSAFAELVARELGEGPYDPVALLRLDKAATSEGKRCRAAAETLSKTAADQQTRLAASQQERQQGDSAAVDGLRRELVAWRAHRDQHEARGRLARAAETQIEAARSRQEELTQIQMGLAGLSTEYREVAATIGVLDQQIAQAAAPLVEAGTVLQAYLAAPTSVAGTTKCPGCGETHNPMRLAEWQKVWLPYVQNHQAFVTQARAALGEAHRHAAALTRQIEQRTARAEALRELLAGVPSAPERPAAEHEDIVRRTEAGIRERETLLSQLEARLGAGQAPAAESIEDLVRRAQVEQERAALHERLASALAAARDELAKVASTAFCERVQRWLPSDKRFGVDLATGEVGFMEPVRVPGDAAGEPTLTIAPGGGDTVRLLGALAAASIPVDTEWALMILPDRFQSPRHLRETMKALSDWPGQVIAQATHPPLRGAVRGWTILDVGKLVGGEATDEE